MTDTTTTETQPEATATETPDTTDWKAEARKWETRSKENKAAADKLAALEASSQTAEQQFEQRLAEIEKRAKDAEQAALRSNIAAEHGISAEDRELFLTGSDEATLRAQAGRLAAREAERKKQGNRAPNEGGTKNTGKDETEGREFVRGLFGRTE